MNTSILSVIIASILLTQDTTPTWQNSYNQALKQGMEQKKPLAIVFGSGADGWTKVVRDANPTSEVTQLLTDKYVCVYVDTATQAGKKMAQEFGITAKTGLVIGDRAGSVQAFWHQGDLTNQNMVRYLQKFSDPQLTVRTTETAAMQTSLYPADSSSDANATPAWQTNYVDAQQLGATRKKPLAIVFGSGPNGWTKIVRDANPSPEVKQLLADKYVCVYVDMASPAGKKTAQDFSITGNAGLVISDRAGSVQAFWHQGDLTNQTMVRYLQKFSQPQLNIQRTETAVPPSSSSRDSFYPSDETPSPTSYLAPEYSTGAPATASPTSYYPTGSTLLSGSSGYCPSCGGRGRR